MMDGAQPHRGRSIFAAPWRSSFTHLGHLRRLVPYIRRYAWVLALAAVGLLLTRLGYNLVPQLMRIAIDSLDDPGTVANYKWPAVGILGVVLLQAGLHLVSRRALRRVSVAVSHDLRKRLFNHIQYQGPEFFTRFDTGDLMARAVSDVRAVRRAVAVAWVNIAAVVFSSATSLYFMLIMSPTLTAWALVPLPLVAWTGFLLARGMFPYYRERQEAMASVTSFAQENLNGIRTIHAMAQEDREIARFRRASTTYARKCYRAARYQCLMDAGIRALTTAAPLIIVAYGGSLVLAGGLTLGAWAAFATYLAMVTSSVSQIGASLSMFVGGAAGTQRIFEILDAMPEVVDDPHFEPPARVTGKLEFKSFTYRHPGAPRPTIRGVDICIDAGETVALLGRVGSGKSTILKAAVRLLNTPPGMVFLDGRDIRGFPVRELRNLVTIVPQDPFLFSATLRENVTYDDPSRDDGEIWNAVYAAGLGRAVREDLSGGLDTLVGERGVTLSGGQKQRATLARGLIRDANVLLLDDCFASVDAQTEEQILAGLRRLRGDRTTILVSHRVAAARHANRIYVIDNGRVVETGTHRQLLARGGYYAELEAVQRSQERYRSHQGALLQDLAADDGVPAMAGRGTHDRN